MLSDIALEYYEGGLSCSRCILKGCEEKYKIKISKDCLCACDGFRNGMGIGGCCGVLIACIMIIGIMCEDVSYYRLEMAERFNKELGNMNCCVLKGGTGCEKIILVSCNILEDIIKKGRKG